MENNRPFPHVSCSTCVCASPKLFLKGPQSASDSRQEKVHQAVGLLFEAANFIRHSKPVKQVEAGIVRAMRNRHMFLTAVAVPYDWLERCKLLLKEAKGINMRKEDCTQQSIPCKHVNKLEEAEALLSNEQVQEVLTLLHKAAFHVEVGWPFILEVSNHPMPWQADNTLPWTISVSIDWLKRCNVFMQEFQAIKKSIEEPSQRGNVSAC